MTKLRSFTSVLCVVVAATTAACSSAPEEEKQAEPELSTAPQIRLDGLYQSSSANGTFVLMEFVDATHYRAWRRDGGVCARLAPGEVAPPDCAETGTYALSNEKLTMTDERTGQRTTFRYRVTSFGDIAAEASPIKPSAVVPQEDLVTGIADKLIEGPSQLLVATNVELIDEDGKKDEVKKSPWPGRLCRAACWGVAGLATGVVAVACTGATVITVGGVAIPCTVAILAVAAGSGVGASLCSDAICPP